MSYTNKSFEELDVLDDFLMNAVATDPQVGEPFCRTVLSVLLERKVGKLRIVAQRAISALTPGLRGIRMDVEVEEWVEDEPSGMSRGLGEGNSRIRNVYDLEPHLQNDTHFPKRNRFYQAKIDSRYMKSGEEDFRELPDLYVLTITNFDPFGYDYMMYSMSNRCNEVPELDYADGLKFIYFYTGGNKGGNEEIRAMLRYLQHSVSQNVTNESIREIHNCVSKVKILPEVKLEYMKFEEIIAYERRDAVKAVAEETQKKTLKQCIFDFLEEYGEIPVSLQKRMDEEQDIYTLQRWLKMSAKVKSAEEFLEKISTE